MIEWNKIQNIIFDLDGVIVNSEFLHYEAYRRAFEMYELVLTLDEYNAKLRSKGRREGLSALINRRNNELIKMISNAKDSIFDQILESDAIDVYEDAIQLIKTCKNKKIPIAIGTASKMGRKVLEKIKLKTYFDAIITSQDVVNNKPHPEIYIKCRQTLNASVNNTIVIEDSEPGIIAALEAQLQVVYIKRENALQLSNDLLNNENVFLCEDLETVSQLLE